MISIVWILWIMVCLYLLAEVYAYFRKKYNRPKIGTNMILLKKLKNGDYIYINSRVLRFEHIARCGETINILHPPCGQNRLIGGELAFENKNGLGYIYYNSSALSNCDFIYGKYGLKWARTKQIAEKAEKEVRKYWQND